MFQISAEDHHLLEVAEEEYGSITGAILAGLRALEQQRLNDADETSRRDRGERAPRGGEGGEGDWYIAADDVAALLEITPKKLRNVGRQRVAAVAGSGDSLEVDLAGVQLARAEAAKWLGRTSATLKRWSEDGKLEANGAGRYTFGESSAPPRRSRTFGLTPTERADCQAGARDTARCRVRILAALEIILGRSADDGEGGQMDGQQEPDVGAPGVSRRPVKQA